MKQTKIILLAALVATTLIAAIILLKSPDDDQQNSTKSKTIITPAVDAPENTNTNKRQQQQQRAKALLSSRKRAASVARNPHSSVSARSASGHQKDLQIEDDSVPMPPSPSTTASQQTAPATTTAAAVLMQQQQEQQQQQKETTTTPEPEIPLEDTRIDLNCHDDPIPFSNVPANKKSKEQEEQEKAVASLREAPEPLTCKKSATLDKSPYLNRKYGKPEDGGWCELVTESRKEFTNFEYRSAFDDGNNNNQQQPQNGSTFSYYCGSSDGKKWPYSQCPTRHKIRCGKKDQVEKVAEATGNKVIKTKALVIYAVTSAGNQMQHHLETQNLIFFLEHGLIPAHTPTALFDEVDFIFTKIQLHGESTQSRFVDCGDFEEAKIIREKLMKRTRKGNSNSKKDSSALAPNIRFLLSPKVPCDICAHAKILDHLGMFNFTKEKQRVQRKTGKKEEESIGDMKMLFGDPADDDLQQINPEKNPYSQMIFLNSGIRGPFFSPESDGEHEPEGHPKTTWVDFVSMAGRRRIPNPRLGFFHHPSIRLNKTKDGSSVVPPSSKEQEEIEDCPIHVASTATLSFEHQPHLQSFFISLPIEIVRSRFFALFSNVCVGGKFDCIFKGEVKTTEALLEFSSTNAAYSLSKQMYLQDAQREDFKKKKDKFYWPPKNPTYAWYDPCKSVFVKNAGHVTCSSAFVDPLMSAMGHLTKGMNAQTVLEREQYFSSNNENNNNNQKHTSIMKSKRAQVDYYDLLGIQKMFQERKCEWKF